MFFVNCDRKVLLDLLPKGGKVAEVGVKRGKFARFISARAKPEKLHLIDPWGKDESDEYVRAAGETAENTEGFFQAVATEFADRIRAGSVVLHRDYSYEAVSNFPDGYFNWVYIDALHTYEPVLADLRAFDAKVKTDGFILGHDFARSRKSTKHRYGVVEAVQTFLKEHPGYELILITNEAYPSFLIAKNPEGGMTRELLDRMFSSIDFVFYVDDLFAAGYRQDLQEFHADGANRVRLVTALTFSGPRSP